MVGPIYLYHGSDSIGRQRHLFLIPLQLWLNPFDDSRHLSVKLYIIQDQCGKIWQNYKTGKFKFFSVFCKFGTFFRKLKRANFLHCKWPNMKQNIWSHCSR